MDIFSEPYPKSMEVGEFLHIGLRNIKTYRISLGLLLLNYLSTLENLTKTDSFCLERILRQTFFVNGPGWRTLWGVKSLPIGQVLSDFILFF